MLFWPAQGRGSPLGISRWKHGGLVDSSRTDPIAAKDVKSISAFFRGWLYTRVCFQEGVALAFPARRKPRLFKGWFCIKKTIYKMANFFRRRCADAQNVEMVGKKPMTQPTLPGVSADP